MAFTPRLNTDGMSGSRYWYSTTNPYYPNFGMPNCTCYAWGRFWEVNNQCGHDETPIGMIGNAVDWYNNSVAYQHGMTPKIGAVACFAGGAIGTGHVAVVEEVRSDGTIVTSNSDYGGTYFYLMTLSPPYSSGSLQFQGFIYNPYAEEPTPPTPTPSYRKSRFPWVLYAKKRKLLKI